MNTRTILKTAIVAVLAIAAVKALGRKGVPVFSQLDDLL